MAIRTISNFPSNGILNDERNEYLRLFELGATRTSTGNIYFTSTTSGYVYDITGTTYDNQGENGLMNLLFYGEDGSTRPKLVDYSVIASDISKIKAATDVIIATGTGTGILLSLYNVTEYETNSKYTFIASANNNGSATTININGLGAKNLYKPNTTTAPNIISGKAYTVWYDGTSFFLQASAEGTAVAGDVLAGTTFSNDSDTGIAGTLALTGTAAVGNVLTGSTFYSTDAKTKLTGTMPNRAGDTAALSSTVAGTTLKLLASNGYRDGTDDYVTITDADFVAGNIKNGVNLFGVSGTFGMQHAYGTTALTQRLFHANSYAYWLLEITGLSFTPKFISAHGVAMYNNSPSPKLFGLDATTGKYFIESTSSGSNVSGNWFISDIGSLVATQSSAAIIGTHPYVTTGATSFVQAGVFSGGFYVYFFIRDSYTTSASAKWVAVG